MKKIEVKSLKNNFVSIIKIMINFFIIS
jgi:hypothetical protein